MLVQRTSLFVMMVNPRVIEVKSRSLIQLT